VEREPRIVLLAAPPDDDAAARLIAWVQRLLFKHPAAAQAAHRALVAEGRRFAETDEGRVWRARLDASETLRRCRPLWEAATLNVLDDDGDGDALPSQLIDLVAQAVSRGDLDAWTATLTEAAAFGVGSRDER